MDEPVTLGPVSLIIVGDGFSEKVSEPYCIDGFCEWYIDHTRYTFPEK